ncbi:MAG: UvrD-helicase domain-containing protein [Clostridiales bacterium]|jgi:ATP-dependent helicase/nuclease subunit A|nr:UvrD-helicase domain-containing protein [Clostridiales bacterium]
MNSDKFEPTPEQRSVIESNADNLLVSASAGSGKTTVMIERILRLLAGGASLSQTAVCTFTKAAAADMRSKLFHALWRGALDGDKRAQAELNLLPTAQISTLHSFAASLIKSHFYVIDVDPDFAVADENDASVLLDRAIEEITAAAVAGADPDFLRFYDAMLTRRKPDRFMGLMRRLYLFAAAQKDFDGWLNNCLNRLPLRSEYTALPGADLEKECVDTALALPFARVLVGLVRDVKTCYVKLKKKRALVDYSDLEYFAAAILRDEAAKKEIAAKYKYVFIDEYQDVNPLQESIINALDTRKFFVGDVKQSIYGFRMCDPSIFTAKRESYQKNGGGKVISLNSNFRSAAPILEFCNRVFDAAMTKEFGGVDYAAAERFKINPAVNKTEFSAVPHVSVTAVIERTDAELPPPRVYSVAAAIDGTDKTDGGAQIASIVNHVRRLIAGGAKYGDIAILSRETGGPFCKRLKAALARERIPVAVKAARPAGECAAVLPLYNYLKLTDNRFDDITLAAVLRSPLGRFTDSELAVIKAAFLDSAPAGTDAYFYEAFFNFTENSGGAAELAERAGEFIARLDYFTGLSRELDASELAGEVCAFFDLFKYAYGMDDGAAKAAELSEFLDAVETSPHKASLDSFLSACETKMPEIAAPAASDAVKIMTIHASKGLEFPHVILANAAKQFNRRDESEIMLADSDEGLALKYFDFENRKITDTALSLIIKDKIAKRRLEEEMRLLYVALTRAKKTLAVFASLKKPPESEPSKQTPPASAKCFFDWILPAVLPKEPAADGISEPPVAFRIIDEPPDLDAVQAGDGSPEDAAPAAARSPYQRHSLPPAPDKELIELVKAALAPLPQPELRAVKTSVTRVLDDEKRENAEYNYLPFADSERAAERGSAYHKIMECAVFGREFPDEWRRLRALLPSECALADYRKIETAYARIGAAVQGKEFYRELPFVAPLASAGAGGGTVLVQGVIDLLIKTDGGAQIIDYKTGVINADKLKTYARQLELYKAAASGILGENVPRAAIYSFESGEFIEI